MFSAQIGNQKLVSNASWKAIQHPAYSNGIPPASKALVQYPVQFDAKKSMGDWSKNAWYTSNFDDSNWPKSLEKGNAGIAPWYNLEPNIVPQLINHGLENYKNHNDLQFPFISSGQIIKMQTSF